MRHPIEDDVNASSVWTVSSLANSGGNLEVCRLEAKHRAKNVTGCLGRCLRLHGGDVRLFCACAVGLRQDSAAQTSSTKPGAPPKAAASEKKASTPARAHSTAVKHSKSNTSSTMSGAHKGRSSTRVRDKNGKRKPRGQQKIDSERAQAIQEALIREHYMTGDPTGTWNQASEDAMRRYQADHGWQSKERSRLARAHQPRARPEPRSLAES